MRVLVTGAAGFVGTHLVPRLRGEGHEVTASDLELDVADASAVESAIAKIEPSAIVHLAALSSVATSWRTPELTYRVNYLGARSILEAAARRAPRARVLLVGSADQYGSAAPGSAPFTEASAQRPRSPYARAKAAADLLGAAYASRGLDVVRVRAFNHTGPGQADHFVLSSFARQAAEIASGRRAPVMRVGNLDSVRDFLDVADVVEAYARLLDRDAPAGAYNVASGVAIRIGDLLDTLLRLANARASVEVDPDRLRPTDFSVGDSSRLRRATGWKPIVPLAQTLERLLDDWRARIDAR